MIAGVRNLELPSASCKEVEPVAHGRDDHILAEFPRRQAEVLLCIVIVVHNWMAVVSAPPGPERRTKGWTAIAT